MHRQGSSSAMTGPDYCAMLTLNASTSGGGWVSLWVFLWSYSIIQCLVYDIGSIETICMLYRNYIYVCIYIYVYIYI